jgi:transcriptional regulator with XRE-family HTH domain
MADRKLFAGHAVRRLRRGAGLTQAAMAEMLGISPSYLNLVERNQRPLTAALLLRLAETFDFDPRTLTASEPGGGAEAIRRRLADPLFADLEVDRSQVEEWLAGAPGGAESLSLDGARLALGLAGNFVLGALMMLGVGLYAPCMILVSLLGMNAKAAFPIMMGSCAFLMPVAGWRFVVREAYAPRVALGLTLGGIPAVLVAAYVVRALSLESVRVLVIGVAVYTATAMLLAARRSV